MMNLDSVIPYGKVLYPTVKEFENFADYVYKVVKSESKNKHGFVKVRL